MGATMKPKYRTRNACRAALSDGATAGTRCGWGANVSRRSGWAMANTSMRLICKSRAADVGFISSRPAWRARLPPSHDPVSHDALDGGERFPGGVGHGLPPRGAWPTVEVVEGQRAGAGRAANHDAADHPGFLVRQAVVVVDPLDREGHLEVRAWLDEKSGVPRLGTLGYSKRVVVVHRVIGGGRMHIMMERPANRLPGPHPEPDGVEPHFFTARAGAHLDLHRPRRPRHLRRRAAGQREPAGHQEGSPRVHAGHFSAAACCGETYQRTT